MSYIAMALAGLVLTLVAASAEEQVKDVLVRFATAAAVIMLADWIAFGWFQLYQYHPHLLMEPEADWVIGELLADVLLVPGLAVFFDQFLPGPAAGVAGALLVTGIEYWAVRLGHFSHHGWKLWYTTIGFVPYFMGLNHLWENARRHRISAKWISRGVRLCLVIDMVVLLVLYLRATHFAPVNLHILPTWMGNQALGRFLAYGLVTIPLGYWVACASWPYRWWRLGTMFALLYALNLWLPRANLQFFRPPYNGAIDAVLQVSAILTASLIQDWLDVGSHELVRS